jgi:hypothetical protein
MTSRPGWNGRYLPWSAACDEVTVPKRVMADGEFKYPIEHEPRLRKLRRLKRKVNVKVRLEMHGVH